MSVVDAEGTEIYPLVAGAARKHGIPIAGLLAMLKAESGLRRTAERWGDRTKDAVGHLGDRYYLRMLLADLRGRGLGLDVSFGYSQLTVATAGGYGIGNGQMTAGNCLSVRRELFNGSTSIDVGARHLSGCYGQADGWADQDLQALIAYNSGAPQEEGNWYWEGFAGNIAGYRAALDSAKGVLGES